MKSNTKKTALPEIYKKKAGNVSETCIAVGISRKTFYEWYNTDPVFKEKIDDVNEGLLDYVEGKLMELIASNEVAPTIFFLKTKGKKRGYVETTEIISTKEIITKEIPDDLLDEILDLIDG